MSNIFDYILWRGDIPFVRDPLNCVDALIFSRLAYLPFDGLWKPTENAKITLNMAEKRFSNKRKPPELLQGEDGALFHALAVSNRFKDISLLDYRNSFDPVMEKQFAAITFLPEKLVFVAFRGTDNTLTGWKEDFNMSFSETVPAQNDAVHYLEMIASKTHGPIYLGGHSKGGNLAVYAALNCQPSVRRRISAVYNNDGPGFSSNILQSTVYRQMAARIHTFVPESSIIGMLLEHEEDYVVVRSSASGIMQHNLYSWEVLGPDFIRLNNTTESSKLLNTTLKEWIKGLDKTERAKIVDTVFSVLNKTEAKTVKELREQWPKNAEVIRRALEELETTDKTNLIMGASKLLRAAIKNLSLIFEY